MITSSFLNLAYFFIVKILAFFPFSSGFPTEFMSGLNVLTSYAVSYNWLFPVSHMYLALATVLGTVVVVFGWHTMKSIISHIPWIGGK